MQQNNFLFVTGFSSKPEILQRNHSFLNDPKQSGSYDNNQNKKPKTDFVQKNKIIVKIQKIQNQQQNGDTNVEQSQQNPLKNTQMKLKKSIISKKLNQSVGLDNSREISGDIVKLSQSFDCKLGQAKKILRRIIPKDQQQQNRPYSTMERYVEETNENQTKFRTNFIKFEQDKENHDTNQNYQSQNEISVDDNLSYKNDNQNYNKSSEHFLSSASLKNQNQKQQGIRCATQPDFDNSIVENSQLLEFINQNDINLEKNRYIAQLNNQILTNHIVKDSYFNQDKKGDNSFTRNLKNSSIEAKKKFINVRNIVNQSLGEPPVDSSDASQKLSGTNKNNKIILKSNQQEQNLIDQYDIQNRNNNNINNHQIKLQQTQNQLYSNKNKKEIENYSTLTFNYNNSTIDQNSPNQQIILNENFKQKNKDDKPNLNTGSNQQTRIQQIQDKNIKPIDSNQSFNKDTKPLENNQSLNNEHNEKVEQNQQSQSQLQTQSNTQATSQINNSQLDNIYIQSQQDTGNFKHQQRIIHKSYDYQIGVKNFVNQNPLYTSNTYNEYQIQSIQAMQNQIFQNNKQNNNNSGLIKQNLILFQNNKKQENNMLKNNVTNQNYSQMSSQFQMELVSDSGFKPQQYGKSPYKQNTKQIIINPNLQKKFNFNSQQIQSNPQSAMNAYLEVNYRANTEPVSQQNSLNQYTPLSVQKKLATQNNLNEKSQQSTGHFNNFLEDFNLDSISINANQPLTKSSQKSRKTVNQVQNQLDINSQSGITPLSLQNKTNAALKNTIRGQSSSQQNQYNNSNIIQNNQQQQQQYIKSASSLGFQEQKNNYNIISNPPLLSQSQDTISELSIYSNKQGNQIYNANSTLSRQSAGTGGQNLVFQFHEVNQNQNHQRSMSQHANRSQDMNLNVSLEQKPGSIRSQSNHNNLNQFQNFKPQSLNFAPPSCSSIQSLYSSKCQNQFLSKYCNSNTLNSSKNLLGDQNQSTMMKEMYTELDEDVRIFDCSPKRIIQLKTNHLQKSSTILSQSLLDFNTASNLTSTSIKSGFNNQNQINELKSFNECAKAFISKLENTNKTNENNQLIDQYLNHVRNRITQLKNKKKNTEIDLILVNTKIIQEIEQTNTSQKQKMPHNLSQQLDEIYQQIKKNIFIYSCQ